MKQKKMRKTNGMLKTRNNFKMMIKDGIVMKIHSVFQKNK